LGPVLVAVTRSGHGWLRGVAIVLTGVLLVLNSSGSHAAREGVPQVVVVDLIHQTAASLWIGELFSLAAVLIAQRRGPPQPGDGLFVNGLARRFSWIAASSVVALSLTGTYQAWLQAGSIDALVQTLHGQTILLKVAIFCGALVIAAVNLWVLKPRLAGRVDGRGAARWFAKLVIAEAVLGGAALAATGLITSLPPARQTYDQLLASRPLAFSSKWGVSPHGLPSAPGPQYHRGRPARPRRHCHGRRGRRHPDAVAGPADAARQRRRIS
ncbi:MAG: CopD family protein, partial [Chloroflexota bacterium]